MNSFARDVTFRDAGFFKIQFRNLKETKPSDRVYLTLSQGGPMHVTTIARIAKVDPNELHDILRTDRFVRCDDGKWRVR